MSEVEEIGLVYKRHGSTLRVAGETRDFEVSFPLSRGIGLGSQVLIRSENGIVKSCDYTKTIVGASIGDEFYVHLSVELKFNSELKIWMAICPQLGPVIIPPDTALENLFGASLFSEEVYLKRLPRKTTSPAGISSLWQVAKFKRLITPSKEPRNSPWHKYGRPTPPKFHLERVEKANSPETRSSSSSQQLNNERKTSSENNGFGRRDSRRLSRGNSHHSEEETPFQSFCMTPKKEPEEKATESASQNSCALSILLGMEEKGVEEQKKDLNTVATASQSRSNESARVQKKKRDCDDSMCLRIGVVAGRTSHNSGQLLYLWTPGHPPNSVDPCIFFPAEETHLVFGDWVQFSAPTVMPLNGYRITDYHRIEPVLPTKRVRDTVKMKLEDIRIPHTFSRDRCVKHQVLGEVFDKYRRVTRYTPNKKIRLVVERQRPTETDPHIWIVASVLPPRVNCIQKPCPAQNQTSVTNDTNKTEFTGCVFPPLPQTDLPPASTHQTAQEMAVELEMNAPLATSSPLLPSETDHSSQLVASSAGPSSEGPLSQERNPRLRELSEDFADLRIDQEAMIASLLGDNASKQRSPPRPSQEIPKIPSIPKQSEAPQQLTSPESEVITTPSSYSSSSSSYSSPPGTPLSVLPCTYYGDPELCDAVLVAEYTDNFRVNKQALASRSPYFRALFRCTGYGNKGRYEVLGKSRAVKALLDILLNYTLDEGYLEHGADFRVFWKELSLLFSLTDTWGVAFLKKFILDNVRLHHCFDRSCPNCVNRVAFAYMKGVAHLYPTLPFTEGMLGWSIVCRPWLEENEDPAAVQSFQNQGHLIR